MRRERMNKLYQSLTIWFKALSLREQRLVIIGSLLVLLGGLYWGGVKPLIERADKAQAKITSEKQLLSWVTDKANEIQRLRASAGSGVSNLPINQAVSSSVSRFNIELIRMQPRGDQFQVWIAPMPFNKFMSWLAFLQEDYGIGVVFLDLEKGEKEGVIEVNRLQLSRG